MMPLQGKTVLDLTNVLAGPFAGYQLAQLGARVIKVESLDGDLARQLGSDPNRNQQKMGISFTAQNAGKESMAVNLKTAAGKEIFLAWVKQADVVLENFRPGVMARLNLDFETLKAHQPRLVYCAISGFGQDGPLSPTPAYDQIVQGYSGAMQVTGTPEQGYRAGFPIADTVGGLTAAMAISAALNQNTAQFIDVSMLESLMSTMGWVISNYLDAGTEPAAWGNDNPTSAPSGTFNTADGQINIAANQQAQWERLVNEIGAPELLNNPNYLTREDRKRNRQQLTHDLEHHLVQASTNTWVERLNRAGIPAGPVLSVPQALKHPQLDHRGFIQNGRVTRGFTVNKNRPELTQAPILGQHTDALLREIGYTHEQITALKEQGTIL